MIRSAQTAETYTQGGMMKRAMKIALNVTGGWVVGMMAGAFALAIIAMTFYMPALVDISDKLSAAEQTVESLEARLAESERTVEVWVGIAQARAEERDAAIFEVGYQQARLEDEECGPAQLFTYPAEGMLLHFIDICFLGLRVEDATPEDIDSPFEEWRNMPAPPAVEGSIVR